MMYEKEIDSLRMKIDRLSRMLEKFDHSSYINMPLSKVDLKLAQEEKIRKLILSSGSQNHSTARKSEAVFQ